MRRLIKHPTILAGIGYISIVILLFRQAIVPPPGWLLYGDDIHRSYYFFREFFNHWMSQGVFPWWNPYLYSGTPFIADPVVNIWYPVNWLFFIIPLPIAYSWHVAFHLAWAMMGMYVLMRQGIGNRERGTGFGLGAWVSGLIFGLSGFFVARTWNGHVDVIAAASWMPWVVWAIYKATKTGSKKDIVIAGGIFALQLLSGYQTMAFMTGIAAGFVVLMQSYIEKRLVFVGRAILSAVIGVGLAAFHLLPVQEFFLQSIRTYKLPYAWVSYGAWDWQSLVQMLHPFFYGDQRSYHGLAPNFGEHSAFVGIAGLILACIGVASLYRARREVRWLGTAFFFIVCFGVWVSLGANAPIDLQYILWKMLPMYHYLRIPTRHLILVVFGLASLAGIGVDFLFRSFKIPKLLKLLITGIIAVEMLLFGSHFIELQPYPEARHDKELISKLTGDIQPYRLLQNFGVWLPARDALDFDSVMSYGIYSVTGYTPAILKPYYEYIARSVGYRGEQAMLSHDVQVPYLGVASAGVIDFLNIKYIIVPPQNDPFAGNPRYTLIWDDDKNKYRLYENSTVLPRFYLSNSSCGKTMVSSYLPNRIELTVESICDTTLMSSEVWYPGWVAYIDGKKTSIDKENNTFRTLFVSSGNHTVVYQYQPTIFFLGAGVSLSVVIILFFWLKRPVKAVARANI